MNKEELNKNTKEQLKMMFPSILSLIFILGGMYLLNIGGLRDVLIYLLVVKGASTGKDIYKFWSWLYGVVKYTLIILSFYSMVTFSMGYGMLGLVVVIIIMAAYKLFGTKEGRSNYINGMRNIETAIFGKPLDKKEWVNVKPAVKIKLKR